MKIIIDVDYAFVARTELLEDMCQRIGQLIGNFFGWSAEQRSTLVKITWR